jgi:hypothetical protein
MKGETPPDILDDELNSDQNVPNCEGEYHWRNTFAHDGQPKPCAKPFRNQRPVYIRIESLAENRIVAKPDRRRPDENSSRGESRSESTPPMNLDIA